MNKIWAIALTTYRESVRSKVLYTVVFFAFLIIGISSFFGAVTVGDQVKVIKDFGLFSISIFTVAFAVISGATLLSKELAKKTIYNILSKAVHRWEFLIGKYIGMLLTTSVMLALMGVCFVTYLYFFEKQIDYLIIYAIFYNFLELVIVCAAAIFFSSMVVTPVLSGLFTFGIFLAGRSTELLLYFINEGVAQGAMASILKNLNVMLPNLDKLNVANEVVYSNLSAFGFERMIWSSIYAISYAGILLILANFIFRRREFN